MNQSVIVNVYGKEVEVTVDKHQHLGAVVTDARWKTGYGAEPFDNWEIRDTEGVLLSPTWPVDYKFPDKVFARLTPGVGA